MGMCDLGSGEWVSRGEEMLTYHHAYERGYFAFLNVWLYWG